MGKVGQICRFPYYTVLYLVANQSAHGHTRVNAHDFVFILSQSLAFFNTMLQLISFE